MRVQLPLYFEGEPNMTRNLVALWLICISLALAGCNTTAGAGRDIEATGDFIEDSAEDAKDY
jgi:predicted small secreted protein